MRRRWLKIPFHYVIIGVAGLMLGVVGLLLIKFIVPALNAATLVYRQILLLGCVIGLFIFSAGMVVYGVSWRRQLRRYEDR